jgi:hypothetical protein
MSRSMRNYRIHAPFSRTKYPSQLLMNNPAPASPRIVLYLPDSYPDTSIAEILAAFDLVEPMVQIQKKERATYAAFEWTIPTVFALYIGKTMVDSLLKELAKEYAPKLLAGTKALALRCKEMGIRWMSSADTPDKLSRNYHQSAGFSIVVQLKGGQQLKMLFDEALSPNEWEEAIDGLLATVVTNYVKYPNDPLTTSAVAQATESTSRLYVAYNRERATWELHNDMTMMAVQRGESPKAES